MQLIIDNRGNGRCIYSELLDLQALGQVQIRRASYVEPDEAGQWWVDLAPLDESAMRGSMLGPFPSRSAALAAEEQWLAEQLAETPLTLPYCARAAPERSGVILVVLLVLLVLVVLAVLQVIGCWDQHLHLPSLRQTTPP
jgi:hypothetical protein